MEELSLNILDIVQNSIAADATMVTIEIEESPRKNIFRFAVKDNGRGMTAELQRRVRDPFTTTRTTRRVGLGLPLLDMIIQQCGGALKIESELGCGTIVEANFPYNHFDRPPLGNIRHTLLTLLSGPQIDIIYIHNFDEKTFKFDSCEIKEVLGAETPFSHPMVFEWLNNFIHEGLQDIYGGGYR